MVYAKKHAAKAAARSAAWYAKNGARAKARRAQPDVQARRRTYMREWRKRRKPHILEYKRSYESARLQTDTEYRLRLNLRRRLTVAIRGNQKTGSAIRDLGCSISELRAYLEAKFMPGMTWENWGRKGWHIDHVIPLASFDLSDPEQLRKAVHYTNLQPLWARDNMIKGGRIA